MPVAFGTNQIILCDANTTRLATLRAFKAAPIVQNAFGTICAIHLLSCPAAKKTILVVRTGHTNIIFITTTYYTAISTLDFPSAISFACCAII